MITTAHMLVGGAVGSLVGEPALALVLGAASHVPLDLLPHYDWPDYRRDIALALGVAVGLLGAYATRGGMPANVFWGMLGGVIPDVENLLWYRGYLKEGQRFFPTHRKGWLRHGAYRGPSNLGFQGILSLGALLVLFR